MTVADFASALQRPFDFVWPLLFGRRIARTHQAARELDKAGKLKILEWYQHIGYIRMLGYSDETSRLFYVDVRPVHFGGLDAKAFDFNNIKYIEFEYYPKGVTDGRHWFDPSTYTRIKAVYPPLIS